MKKLLTIFALMLVCIGQTFAYDFVVNGIYYNKSGSNATVTYESLEDNCYSGIVVIPATVTYNEVTYNVTSIGISAFWNCSGLTSITIPNGVKSIENGAFSGCSDLTSITIPNSVTSMGNSTFENCSGLTSITIPNSVTSIGNSAFYGCSGLTSITIPNSVTSIGNYAFTYCSGLISITIPDGVTSIGSSAFRDCSGLTSVTIGNGVTSIGLYAFDFCSGLTSITNMAIVPQTITSNTFSTYSGVTLHVLEGCKDAYAVANYWKDFTIVDDIGADISFNDGNAYTSMNEIPYKKVTYTRTFNNTNWQALYIPFSLDYEEWKDDFDIAEIHNFIEYDDDENGEFDRTYLVVLKKTSGSTEPNYPYLIRAKETGSKTLVLTDKTLEAAENNSIDCSSVKNRYTFTGTYTPVTDMYANGYYALSGGALNRANDAGVTLDAQRWYMEVTSRTGGAASVKAQSIRILVDGEEGIDAPSASPKGENPVAYDLMGRGVKGAVKGVNIVNGKKIIR